MSSASDTEAAAPGGVLAGRYRLGARIGAGGMATIFRGRDTSLERDVAVKVLHAHLADDPDLRERFRTEARHAAGLLHPHIVTVFDQGVADLPYIVMEHVDGPSLREVLDAHGRLSSSEALAVIEPVCRALARAHAAGVVHRDVKPENVLIAADGTPKVADFGIARALAATNHTQAGALLGSVHYLAPELVDAREATPASDQYAVGVVLFELLTGRKPLPAESPMAVALRHAQEEIPPPSRDAEDVPEAVDAVVARATARDPDDRFPDVLALAAALREAVPGGPTPVVVPPAKDDGREHTLVIAPAEADTVAVERDDTPPPPPGRAGRRRRGRRLALLAVVLLALLMGGGWAGWNYVLAPVEQVPTLVGDDLSTAKARLAQIGLDLAVAGREHSMAQPEGAILDQDPVPGGTLRRGGEISVVVSDGPATVTMPSVLELPREEAVTLLEAEPYFFTVAVHEDYSDHVPAGLIQAQKPDAEEPLVQGSEVIVNVSLGVEQVTVPDLSGMDRAAAAAALEKARLTASFSEAYSDAQPTPGAVVSQSLDAGATVDKGTTVAVVISKGPQTFKMPNVRGKTVDQARAILEAEGLRVQVEGVARPSFGPIRRGQLNRVEEQLPQPGTPVERGERVTLYTYVE